MNICPFSFFLNHTPAAMNRESVKASRQEHHANNCHWPSPLSSETKVLTKWPTAVLFLFLSVSQHNARDHFRRSESWNFMQWRFLIFVPLAGVEPNAPTRKMTTEMILNRDLWKNNVPNWDGRGFWPAASDPLWLRLPLEILRSWDLNRADCDFMSRDLQFTVTIQTAAGPTESIKKTLLDSKPKARAWDDSSSEMAGGLLPAKPSRHRLWSNQIPVLALKLVSLKYLITIRGPLTIWWNLSLKRHIFL